MLLAAIVLTPPRPLAALLLASVNASDSASQPSNQEWLKQWK